MINRDEIESRRKLFLAAMWEQHQAVMQISEAAAISNIKFQCSTPCWCHSQAEFELMNKQIERRMSMSTEVG